MAQVGLLNRESMQLISVRKPQTWFYRVNTQLSKQQTKETKEKKKKEKDFFTQTRTTGVINLKDGKSK